MPMDSTSQEVGDKEDILPVLPKNDVVATGAMRQEIPDSEDVGSEEGSIKDIETPNDGPTEDQSCHPSPLPDSLGSPESEVVKFAGVPSNEKEENINDTGDGGDVQEKHERADSAPPLDSNETEQVDKPAQGIEGINDEKVDVVTSKPINAPTASEQQVPEHKSQPSVDHGIEGDLTAAAQDAEHVLPSSGPTLSNIHTEKSIPDSDDSGSVSSASDHDVEEKAFSESYKQSKVASLDAELPSTDNWHSVRAEDRAEDAMAHEPKAIVDQNTISRDIINNVATAKETSEETGLSMNAQQSAIMREQDGEMPSESQESAEYSRGSLVRSSAAEASKQHITEKTEETNELETTQERQINSCTTATIQSSSDETLDASGAEAVLEKTSIQDGEILSSTDNSAQDGVTVQIARSTPLIEVSSSSPHHEPALEQDEEVDMIDTPTSSPPILYESTSNRQDPCADEEDTPMSDISTAPVPTTERSKMPSQDAETDEDSGKNKPPNPPPVIPEPKTTKKDKDKNVKMSDVSAKLSQPVAKAGEKRSLSRSASASASPQPNKDVLLTELKNIKIASIQARNAALQAEIDAKRAKLEEMKRELKYPAAETVKNHIKLLHDYNDIRDVGQGLVGMIADNRGVRIGELYDEFGVGLQD